MKNIRDEEIKRKASVKSCIDTLDDLNQPLNAINNYVEAGRHLLGRGYASEETLVDLFEKLSGQVSRCYELSRELQKAVHNKEKNERHIPK